MAIQLNWPDGYSFNLETGELTVPSTERSQTLPVFVTGIILTVSGEGMTTITLDVPLDTLTVSFAVTPGVRTFTVVVSTDFPGVSFADTVTIEVITGSRITLTFSLTLNVPPLIDSLVAAATNTFKGDPVAVSVAAHDLNPADTTIFYSWDGGGGTITGSGDTVIFTSNVTGAFEVCVTVSDPRGASSTSCVTITVANRAPSVDAVNVSSASTFVNTPVSVTAVVTDPDPGETFTYAWNGGGGNISGSGATVTFTANTKGTFTVCVIVTDSDGATATGCSDIRVVNRAPVINAVTADDTTPILGQTITATCAATDPDGDPLTYNWADGLGWTATGATVPYTQNVAGAFTLTCTVNDPNGATASAAVVVTFSFTNRAPSVTSVIIVPTNPAVGSVATATCNATDPDGDPLTYNWTDDAGFTFTSAGNTAPYTVGSFGTVTLTCQVTDGKSAPVALAAVPVVNPLGFSDGILSTGQDEWLLLPATAQNITATCTPTGTFPDDVAVQFLDAASNPLTGVIDAGGRTVAETVGPTAVAAGQARLWVTHPFLTTPPPLTYTCSLGSTGPINLQVGQPPPVVNAP